MPRRPITEEERAFATALGRRIAALRVEAGLTQTNVGDELGISQQSVDDFEKGRTRVPIYTLVRLVDILDTPVQEILQGTPGSKKRRGPDSKLERRIAQLRSLPRGQQKTVLAMIDGVIGAAQ